VTENATDLEMGLRRAARRLVWVLVLLYFFAVLDRVNVGIAGLTMRRDLGLSAGAFGFGAGAFFLGYVLFEVPSNLLLERFGARAWLARIVVSWGLAAMAVALARGAASFVALRILLGIAEAGFFPGVIFYLTLWFPRSMRARITALFLLGVPLSNALAAALSSLLLGLGGTWGLAGWQWLFVLEGAPPVLLGLLVLALLPDRLVTARWLTPGQAQAIEAALTAERPGRELSVRDALLGPMVWGLGVAYFGINVALTALGFWLPQVVHAIGPMSVLAAGLISAAVLLPGALAMVLWSRRSDRRGERVIHVSAAAFVAATGWAFCALSTNPVLSIALLTLASAGTYATLAIFWTYPAALLSGRAAAGGIALIGAVGNLGGFAGPWAIGQLRQASGGFASSFVLVGACLLLTAAIAWTSGQRIFAA